METFFKSSLVSVIALMLFFPIFSFANKKIQIYTFENPPLVTKTAEGLQGLSGDYGKIVAEAILGSGKAHQFEVVWLPYKRALLWIEKNPQGLFFALDRIAERENKFNWVMHFGEVDCWLYALNPKIRIDSLMDLRKYRIGVQGGSAREAEVRRYVGWSRKVEALADDSSNLRKLQANRIDIWATRPMVLKEAERTLKSENVTLKPLRPLRLLFKQSLWMIGNRNMSRDSRVLVESIFGWEGKKPMKSPALSATEFLKIPKL